jgi:alpha-L-rhamnosidase
MRKYGKIVSTWELQEDKLRINATIPPNTTATIRLPGAGRQVNSSDCSVSPDGQDGLVEVGSGSYVFAYPYNIPQD